MDSLDSFGNSPLANAVHCCRESTSLMLLQRGADLRGEIDPKAADEMDRWQGSGESNRKKDIAPQHFRYLPRHFASGDEPKYTIFEGIVRNSWLGLTYLALERLQTLDGFNQTTAIEVAFRVDRLRFAKTLITKQIDLATLRRVGHA